MSSNLIKLTPEYLQNRYEFWKEQIGKTKIWDSNKFKKVKIIIRKNHRRYNALFQRKLNKTDRTFEDKIIVYNKVEAFDKVYLDSLIVHEMIHQYLTQNNINGKHPHGAPFIEMMTHINKLFPSQLNIQIKSNNPVIPLKGNGKVLHYLLFIFREDECYCCIIHHKKIRQFNLQVRNLKRKGGIKDYLWAQSYDCHFDNSRRCMKVLSGVVIPAAEMKEYCKKYNIIQLSQAQVEDIRL